jgi:16S rRNA (cytosine1402-N4)-methyltransferase
MSDANNSRPELPGEGLHKPVFLEDVLTVFRAKQGVVSNLFDGTFGRGGHTRAIMHEYPSAKMVAFDWDEEAIRFGREKFAAEIESGRLHLVHASYADFKKVREASSAPGFSRGFDLMLLDLGVSSPQLDTAERGFSFYHEGPLDMRMDQRLETTAADIVNTWEEQDLARLFIEYGEVQRPFRVVRAICHDRKTKPFVGTKQLAGMIERVDGWHKKGSHPATRYFLALRLKVNEELSTLARALPELIDGLAPGGVLAVITFHSLEDRIVKNVFKEHLHVGRLVNKKVIKPSDEETRANPRARSAKLRAFEKGPVLEGEKEFTHDEQTEDQP